MADQDFPEIFTRLKSILEPYAPEMEVNAESDVEFGLQTHWRRPKDGYPGYFASVKIGKRYVSYHLMPVYGFPKLKDDLSDGLRSRMQGKSCFSFTVLDEQLFVELERLTRSGYEAFAENGLLENADG
jgi:hypothetical protein